jgi:hypothetical protein
LPAATLAQQRRLLALLEQGQLARLRLRREQARQLQLRAQMRVWRREARQGYDQAVSDANARYASQYGDALAADGARRLNLTLQIAALERTVGHWTLSTPPAPGLDRARQELATDRALLALLDARQTGAVTDLGRSHAAALAQAAADRVTFVERQRARLSARLLALDQTALSDQRALLARETAGLLVRERQLVAGAIPGADVFGPLSLPGGAAPVPATGASLQAAVARLTAQRARWVQGLYAETQAAADEAARRRGWRVTFAPRRGEVDRTAQLAALLAGRDEGS